jgi:diguanylate cyclase (GGDEF)-like protein
MPGAGRATGRPAGKRAARAGSATAGASDGSDLAARLASRQSALRSLLNRRDTLLDIIRTAQATLEPALVARAIVERCCHWLPLTCWAVAAPATSEALSVLADAGLSPDLEPGLQGVAGWVMQHDHLFASGDLRTEHRVTAQIPAAAIGLPLRGRARVVGALVGLDRGTSAVAPMPGGSLQRALDVALAPAGFALDASLALERFEALSVTDDLTRLYNSRYLNMALRRESRLTTRTGRPLSLLFIDLDGFKSINDNHGHLAGSRALVEAANVIRGSARETDIVARFGGDEFALILPDTGPPGALAVAERVRDRLARHSFLAGDGLGLHLTASVGVATLPDVAATAEELVQAADGAMYQVKDRGKNGIQAASRADK